MTEDIKQLFSEHRPDGERPLSIDAETVARGGARRLRRRTAGLVGAAVVTVAVLTAGTITLPQHFGGSADAADEAADTFEQPSHPLPDLEPLKDGDHYVAWVTPDDEGKRTDAADRYGDAYVAWFEKEMDVEFEHWPGVRVFEEEIRIWSDKEKDTIDSTGHWPPRYRIAAVTGSNIYSGPASRFSHNFGGDYDQLFMTVYPRDGYLPGSGEGAEYLQNCKERKYNDVTYETTCTDATGPAGERILQAVTESYGTEGDIGKNLLFKTFTVTLYRQDGTAVQVGTTVPGVSMEDSTNRMADYEAELDFEELTDLALSMPDAIVTG